MTVFSDHFKIFHITYEPDRLQIYIVSIFLLLSGLDNQNAPIHHDWLRSLDQEKKKYEWSLKCHDQANLIKTHFCAINTEK